MNLKSKKKRHRHRLCRRLKLRKASREVTQDTHISRQFKNRKRRNRNSKRMKKKKRRCRSKLLSEGTRLEKS